MSNCKNCGCDEIHHNHSDMMIPCSNCHKRIMKYDTSIDGFKTVFIHECREFEP